MDEQSQGRANHRSVQERIEQAHNLLEFSGNSLIDDPHIHALLSKLRDSIGNTKQSMSSLGVVAECRSCEEKEGGSCCGAGIENKYDTVLLLINLLLGCSLQDNAPVGNSCYFLGKHGCTLTARHVLCVNYICEKLKKKLKREELIALQTCGGEELDTLFFLHEAIKKRLRSSP